MNCREAQSMIHAFIDDKLNDEECAEFLEHIHSCSSCYDELEVYFTVTEAMKHFDDSEEDIPANLPKGASRKDIRRRKPLEKAKNQGLFESHHYRCCNHCSDILYLLCIF